MSEPASSSVVRFEVEVPESDAGLVKGAVAALADPDRRVQARSLLRRAFSDDASRRDAPDLRASPDLKALLTSPLLQGVDLERSRDCGRDIDL